VKQLFAHDHHLTLTQTPDKPEEVKVVVSYHYQGPGTSQIQEVVPADQVEQYVQKKLGEGYQQ
jgi:hypothetical protein